MSREYQLRPFERPPELRINYEAELNGQQLAAVTASGGPSLVLAGAGAGKTRTLTYRVAWLIEHGVPPDRILLLTFTNKSAREMMHRVTDLIGGDMTTLWGGTFHSIGNRILRRHPERLGYPPSFSIVDREDAKELLETCIVAAGIDGKEIRFPKADALNDLFSRAVNTRQDLAKLIAAEYSSLVPVTEQILKVQKVYADKKRVAGLMDFDDLLVLWLRLLRENDDLREVYQRRFQWVLVDEYQDTNRLQGELLDELAARYGNLMAVGDDAQSIYSWRGAHFANILDFPKRYPKAQVFRIETNYRSTPEILEVANAAIAPNTRQHPKELIAARKSGSKPALVVCTDTREQSGFIAQRVLELREEGVRLDHMCVLYRSHFHALEIQLELTRQNIPFVITSGIRFFEQAHIKDVAAYLKLVSNPYDELAFKRLVRMLPGVGGKGAEKLWGRYQVSVVPTELDATAQPTGEGAAPLPAVAPALGAMTNTVPKKTAASWAQFTATIAQMEAKDIRDRPGALIRHVLEAVYNDYVKETYENPRSRLDDLEQLANYAEQFPSTLEFLSQLALQSHLEAEENRPASEDDERLKLSSIHQAKGLEFSVVFVIMLSDGLFPSLRSLDSQDTLEEERRLFYVAVTRAKNELYLTRPLIRFSPGGGESFQQPSQFLTAIPPALLDEWHLSTFGRITRPEPPREPDYTDDSPEPDYESGDQPF
ncbi:MAG TPA: ATP-dependent helicase [Candidatus Limnocylindria bacterium]|nr:ATP-dependent helicase [Candidatus Limnocylindria bacterium]